MRRLEKELPDSDWHHWLIEALDTASFVLADLTDHNPFVTYELGLAHSRRLPTMLILDSRNDRISPTVRGSMFLPYDNDALAPFEHRLGRWTTSTLLDLKRAPSNGDSISYERALGLFEELRKHSPMPTAPVTAEEYGTRLLVAQGRGDHLRVGSEAASAAWYLLSHVMRDSDKTATMSAIEEWTRSRD